VGPQFGAVTVNLVTAEEIRSNPPVHLCGLHERLDPPRTRAQLFGQLTQFLPSQPNT
jgi:hypothetical protein